MKTKTLTGLGKIYDTYDSLSVRFCPVSATYACVGYESECKEEVGAQAVKGKHNKFIMQLSERLTNEEVEKLIAAINKKEKKLKVKASTISFVQHKRKLLLVEHSPRWSRNSVAHSILMTIIRSELSKYLPEIYEDLYNDGDDKEQISDAKWLWELLNKKGLGIFGIHQHTKYDVGMVKFMRYLKVCGASDEEPLRMDYHTQYAWLDALDAWEELRDFNGGRDTTLPKKHGYEKIIKMYKELKK